MSFRALFLTGLAGLLLSHTAGAETWKRYTNERFGTLVEVPAEFTAQPPPANNDGRTFVSKDGSARILVYGSHAPSVVVQSFAAYKDWVTDQEAKSGLGITYTGGAADWFALSGVKGSTVIYMKVVAGCADRSVAHHVRVEYPASEKAGYDPTVTRVARSLRAGRAGCS
jgi:hypothetical protein